MSARDVVLNLMTGEEADVMEFEVYDAETNEALGGEVTSALIRASSEAFGGTGIVLAVDLGGHVWELVREDEREMYPGARRVYVMRD